jgi:hypothetical protein
MEHSCQCDVDTQLCHCHSSDSDIKRVSILLCIPNAESSFSPTVLFSWLKNALQSQLKIWQSFRQLSRIYWVLRRNLLMTRVSRESLEFVSGNKTQYNSNQFSEKVSNQIREFLNKLRFVVHISFQCFRK